MAFKGATDKLFQLRNMACEALHTGVSAEAKAIPSPTISDSQEPHC